MLWIMEPSVVLASPQREIYSSRLSVCIRAGPGLKVFAELGGDLSLNAGFTTL